MNRKQRRAAAKQGGAGARGPVAANVGPALLAEAARQHEAGRLAEAERLYRRLLADDPNRPDCLHLLGLVVHQTGRSEAALELIGRAIALNDTDPDFHNDIAGIYQSLGRFDQAVAHCRKALALDPRSAAARLNLARALYAEGDLPAALAEYQRVVEQQPGSFQSHYGLAVALYAQGNREEGMSHYRRVLELRPDHAEAHTDLGIALAARGRSDRAIAHYRAALAARPDSADALNALGEALMMTGELRPAIATAQRAVTLKPDFARAHANHAYFKAQACEWRNFDRVAAHLLALLRQEMPDIPPFVVLMLPATPADCLRAARQSSEGFARGVTRMSHAPPAVPRPIRLGYLSHDLRGDVVGRLIPELIERHDRSRFAVNAYCYGPDDGSDARRRLIAAFDSFTDLTGVVFCCFNHSYKLTPAVFGIWMRLLLAVPRSVLWLYEANAAAPDNLRREALARGVTPERLVFARYAPMAEYLARLGAADLFLDTLPYNAGATANDALWAGLPVLTCVGDSYVGRMAASMLHAIGLPDLVTSSLAEYEARALQLAQEPARLTELRQRLSENRARMPLFDMARYTRDIDAAYAPMWDRWLARQSTARC